MPSSFRSRLGELAVSFSASVLDAIRGASLDELMLEAAGGRAASRSRAPSPGERRARRAAAPAAAIHAAVHSAPSPRRRGGRLARRSASDISNAVDEIVGLLKNNPSGLRAEQIRQKLGLQAKELPRPLKDGLEAGRLSKAGEKRATTYFAGARASKVSASAPRASRLPAKRRGRPPSKASKASVGRARG